MRSLTELLVPNRRPLILYDIRRLSVVRMGDTKSYIGKLSLNYTTYTNLVYKVDELFHVLLIDPDVHFPCIDRSTCMYIYVEIRIKNVQYNNVTR